MEPECQYDLDITDPAWSEDAGGVVKSVLEAAPKEIRVQAAEAPAQSALSAQLLLFLRRHVESVGGTFSVADASPAFSEGLSLLGLHDLILGTAEVQQ
ncbi:hypothetical protein DSD19_19565 [Rhodovulum sp. BSW8]|uniref:STAS domain-containing protein n=1 Tax=Rhodovulum visakhapatnamense TaxID=364297 RepID=A0A4R8G2B6_9RHOB|nr:MULTISPECIES: STAS domain-containing protein [Rhodovulum]OLS46235.1 hypothetical protein BV509_19025 [Rhodovulum sulfidophilum]MBL3568042.1 hypothetical protein [Rhodovulum visakhapatnamense]MBL3577935.1 hypothetical protein [Rhodovulum visakhapatnamense]RBO51488.1 hypothetical protein DSD19_19565 [Rhodovulum sp. BSW8]TDX30716.1 hypothetical protein EV657_106201 [Rhodovulum visakhapatnamense]